MNKKHTDAKKTWLSSDWVGFKGMKAASCGKAFPEQAL